MAFQKIALRGGINREGTRYTNEGGWYDGDKIRFRQGTPEKIGGWQRIGSNTFLGVCRALHNWVSLAGANFVGLGTNLKVQAGLPFIIGIPNSSYSIVFTFVLLFLNRPTIIVSPTFTSIFIIFPNSFKTKICNCL